MKSYLYNLALLFPIFAVSAYFGWNFWQCFGAYSLATFYHLTGYIESSFRKDKA